MSTMFEKVREILVENLGCSEDEVKMESDLVEDLEADSLDIVELSMALEDEFGISIPDEDFEKLQKVEGIIEYIKNLEA